MKKIEKVSKQKPNYKNQYLAALVVNIPTAACSISNGWSSAANVLLTSDETPLPSGKISMDEASWIASLIYIGGLIGTFFFGYISKKFGRKWLLISLATLSMISWLLALFAQNVYYLYASRAINGFFGSGVYIVVPIFLVEISSDDVRGKIISSWSVADSIGILLGFVLGTFNFNVTPIFVIVLLILFPIVFVFFPETPAFLLQKNKIAEMGKSIQFYQNADPCPKSIKSNSEIDNSRNTFKWSDITSNPGRKAMIISVFLTSLYGLCGISAILNYLKLVFDKTGSTISPKTSTLVIGIILVIGNLTVNSLVDCTGRKILYTLSSTGLALGLVILGIFMMLKSWNYSVDVLNFIPLASLSFSIFVSSLSVYSMQISVASELLPNNLKEEGISLCIAVQYILIFGMTKLLPFLMNELEFYGCMYLFASICLFGALCIIRYMPETKGKSYEQIMESLR